MPLGNLKPVCKLAKRLEEKTYKSLKTNHFSFNPVLKSLSVVTILYTTTFLPKMKYFAAILSIASLALATTEVAPGNVVKQQGVGNITISPVEALRILV